MSGDANPAFQTTSWSLVLAAASDPTNYSRAALATLCGIYWSPVYAFIRRRGYSGDEAQDLTQSFFARLIENDYVRDADRQRGKFRTFLQTSVKHFLANEWDRTHALKRGGHQIALPIDPVEVESWYAPEVMEPRTPENLFERRWAVALLEQVMAKLRAEFIALGRLNYFERLSTFLNGDPQGSGYEALSIELGGSPAALRVAVHRMRRRFRELLRAEIAETVSRPEEIDEEIRFLMSTLSKKP
jgi:RNA polymerase sigma factor (sigma-70 family)